MTALDSAKNTLHSFYKSVAEYVTPISDKSEFNEKGVLTPEEFVTAGNQLVYKCPTWTWESCEASKRWPFLPKGKQYLLTRNVPCVRRVSSLEAEPDDEEVVEDGEWLSTYTHHTGNKVATDIEDIELDTGSKKENEKTSQNQSENGIDADIDEKKTNEYKKDTTTIIANIDEEYGNKVTTTSNNTNQKKKEKEKEVEHDSDDSFEEIPDIESFDDTSNIVTHDKKNDEIQNNPINTTTSDTTNEPKNNDKDKFFSVNEEEETIVKTRTYDMSITYDKFYRVPRVWLRGYDEKGTPLTSKQIMEDISADHAHKTVTVESHPHNGMVCASIHPCRHGEVMKRFMDRLEEGGKSMPVDDYLFLFLKFMSAVIPTIEYDYTHGVLN